MNATEEPEKTPSHPPIGIDLGTTYSAAAYVDHTGRPICIPNGTGEILTPSAILFDSNDVVIGKEAVRCSVTDPDIFAECFKRDVGSDHYRKEIHGVSVPPEVLSALVLDRIKQDVVRQLGSLDEAVITVPAFFDERRRRATQEAARMAGIRVLDIINEPTAAALAYGFNQGLLRESASDRPAKILVYDLGGGTFDVTILKIAGRHFQTLATDGDVQLGGRDFDERIFNYLAEQFLESQGVDPRSNAGDCAQLWLDAQQTKHSLSERSSINVVVSHAGIRQRMVVTRQTFEQISQDLLSRTESTTTLVLKQADVTWDDIEHVLVVGGSSRMPMVIEMLERLSGKSVNRTLSPDEAIAWGAAIYANVLSGKNQGKQRTPFNVLNVNSHSLGIIGRDTKTRRRMVQHVIPKNTPLPHVVQRKYPTMKAGQRSVAIRIVEGESTNPDQCSKLGTCQITELPPGLRKGETVVVQYRYEPNGLISVSARMPVVRRTAAVEIKHAQTTNLDSLATWRDRIRLGVVESQPQPGQAPEADVKKEPVANDRQQQLNRLDDLYVLVGHLVLGQVVPRKSRKSHEIAAKAIESAETVQAELADLLAQQEGAQTSADRIRFYTALAQLKEQLQTVENEARYSLIQLGREAHQAGSLPDGCEEHRQEIDRLRTILQ